MGCFPLIFWHRHRNIKEYADFKNRLSLGRQDESPVIARAGFPGKLFSSIDYEFIAELFELFFHLLSWCYSVFQKSYGQMKSFQVRMNKKLVTFSKLIEKRLHDCVVSHSGATYESQRWFQCHCMATLMK